jgi:hypothetical protein
VSPNPIIQEEVSKLIANGEVLSIEKVKSIAREMMEQVSEKDSFVSSSYDIDTIIR